MFAFIWLILDIYWFQFQVAGTLVPSCTETFSHTDSSKSYYVKLRARTFGRRTVRRGTVRRDKKMLVSARLG